MSDHELLFECLERAGLDSWRAPLEPLLRDRFADSAHGDISKWRAVIDHLPDITNATASLDSAAVTVTAQAVDPVLGKEIRELLLQLRPWRKGPFKIHGIAVDAEWRSDLKWDRLKNEITPLADRRVLDVGCGNGYYALRMLGDGARWVIGIDPTLLFVFQFLALNHFLVLEVFEHFRHRGHSSRKGESRGLARWTAAAGSRCRVAGVARPGSVNQAGSPSARAAFGLAATCQPGRISLRAPR